MVEVCLLARQMELPGESEEAVEVVALGDHPRLVIVVRVGVKPTTTGLEHVVVQLDGAFVGDRTRLVVENSESRIKCAPGGCRWRRS